MVTEWITRLAPQTSRRPSVVVHSTAVAVDHDTFANVGVDGTLGRCCSWAMPRAVVPGGPLADAAKAGLLIPDEFGYVPFDADGTRLPCQVLSESHERRSVTFAINVEFGGPSHRPEESLMLGRSGRWGWRRARDETRKKFVR